MMIVTKWKGSFVKIEFKHYAHRPDVVAHALARIYTTQRNIENVEQPHNKKKSTFLAPNALYFMMAQIILF